MFERYNRYVDAGRVDQEERWGKRAFAGAIVSMAQLPANQSFKLMFGKNEQNGGFDRRPNAAWGGQYSWMPTTSWKLSVQTMNQRSYQDGLLLQRFGSQIHTVRWSPPSVWAWELEAGYSGYTSTSLGELGGLLTQANSSGPLPNIGRFWSGLLHRSRSGEQCGRLCKYQRGRGCHCEHSRRASRKWCAVVSTNSSCWVWSAVEQPHGGRPEPGLPAAKLVHQWRLQFESRNHHGRQQLVVWSACECPHPQPLLALGFPSRWVLWSNQRHYRNTFDRVTLSERLSDQLYFSQLELQALYRLRIADRLLVFNHLMRTSSVQTGAALINTGKEALLRQYASENELYVQWNNRFAVVLLASGDITLGGILTGVNPIGRPFEQFGSAWGAGCDIWAADNVCVYVRHRRFALKTAVMCR